MNLYEICDDGANLGMEPGDCAPDCSAEVESRQITLGAAHDGNLVELAGLGDLPERVDGLCPLGYKALFAFGGQRTGTLNSFAGDGQVDWPLRPFTYYLRDDATWIGTTDDAALLGVRDGVWVGLEHPISEGDAHPWTGMAPDYRKLDNPIAVCDGFSTASERLGWTGDATLGKLDDAGNFLQAAQHPCAVEAPVICVEQ